MTVNEYRVSFGDDENVLNSFRGGLHNSVYILKTTGLHILMGELCDM